jgi:NAD-dependent SIR2 family protein deacetylase
MADTVFILGAGASFEAGAPLMSTFLDRAEDLRRMGEVDDCAPEFDKVFSLIDALQALYAKSELDLNNIEALFGILEMASTVNRLYGIPEDQIGSHRDALIMVIVKTLERSIKYHFSGGDFSKPQPTDSYRKFVGIIKLLSEKFNETSSIITFNYDTAVDHALHDASIDIQYCTEMDPEDGIRLLKLHGSTNWGACSKCHSIVPYDLPTFFSKHNRNLSKDGMYGKFLEVSMYLPELSHCGKPLNPVPVIVPPTWNKSSYHGALSNVWSAAAQELSEARNIYVFGYSLPESDPFFRYLFALGTLGSSRIRRFWVFDPNEDVKNRYEGLIGSGIRSRFRFYSREFLTGRIVPGGAMDTLINEINK